MVLNDGAVHSVQKCSLHQYNFLAGSCKTIPLACRSKDWIKIQTLSSRWLPPVVKGKVGIFFSRTDLTHSLSFHADCRVPKIVFSATSSVLNGNDLLYFASLATLLSLRCGWLFRSQQKQVLEKHSHQVLQPLIPYGWTHPNRTLDVYWPVRKTQVARGESMNCKYFDVLLTVHLSTFISVFNQLDAQNMFTISFVSCLYMFRAYVFIIRRSKLHYTASGIIPPTGGMIPEAV